MHKKHSWATNSSPHCRNTAKPVFRATSVRQPTNRLCAKSQAIGNIDNCFALNLTYPNIDFRITPKVNLGKLVYS